MNSFERYFLSRRDPLEIVVFRRSPSRAIGLFNDFDFNRAEAGLNHFRFSVEDDSTYRVVPDTDSGSFVEENLC